jgi:hypothetical protein
MAGQSISRSTWPRRSGNCRATGERLLCRRVRTLKGGSSHPRPGRHSTKATFDEPSAESCAAGLPLHMTPHCLRRALASLLLQQGESPAYVQRQLGHADIQLTVDTYGKWLPMGNKAAVDRLDEAEPQRVAVENSSKAVAGEASGPADAEADQRPSPAQAVERERAASASGLVRPARFERATYRFVVCRSIHLS